MWLIAPQAASDGGGKCGPADRRARPPAAVRATPRSPSSGRRPGADRRRHRRARSTVLGETDLGRRAATLAAAAHRSAPARPREPRRRPRRLVPPTPPARAEVAVDAAGAPRRRRRPRRSPLAGSALSPRRPGGRRSTSLRDLTVRTRDLTRRSARTVRLSRRPRCAALSALLAGRRLPPRAADPRRPPPVGQRRGHRRPTAAPHGPTAPALRRHAPSSPTGRPAPTAPTRRRATSR